MSKLRLEACLWGAGTALVELPSYFVAKTCRLSGCDPDDAGDRKKRDDLLKIFDKIFDSAFLPSTREEFQKKVMGKSAGTFFLILAYASVSTLLELESTYILNQCVNILQSIFQILHLLDSKSI